MNISNFLHIHVISFQLNSVNKSSTASFIVYLKLKYWNRMCSSFSQQIHNIRLLRNDLAFKSFLYSLSIHFYKFGTLPCLILTCGSDTSRSISGHNMNTSIRLHIRSTSGVSRDNQRIQQFLKKGEALILCPNSTATRALLFRAGKQSNIWATVCVSKPFTTYIPNGWRLLIARESLGTRRRKLDETDRSWSTFTHRHVTNGSLGGPVLKWPGYKQEDRGIVGGFPAASIFPP